MIKSTAILLILATSFCGCKDRVYELAYATDKDNVMDICLTHSENGQIRNLTNSDVTEYNLIWSDDGKEIYYTSYNKDGRAAMRINVATGERTTIIQDSSILSISDVSRDKSKLIISTKEHDPKGELYVFDVGTQSKIRLTHNNLYEAGAKFSNDEFRVVASIQTHPSDSINHAGIAEIFVIDLPGLEYKQLTKLNLFSGLPDYAPDGNSIAFHVCDMGICDIYIMNSDGTDLRNITHGDNDNRWPRWSPDGKWIAFTKTIDGNSDIYFISADGLTIKPVIATEFRDEIAIFKPM